MFDSVVGCACPARVVSYRIVSCVSPPTLKIANLLPPRFALLVGGAAYIPLTAANLYPAWGTAPLFVRIVCVCGVLANTDTRPSYSPPPALVPRHVDSCCGRAWLRRWHPLDCSGYVSRPPTTALTLRMRWIITPSRLPRILPDRGCVELCSFAEQGVQVGHGPLHGHLLLHLPGRPLYLVFLVVVICFSPAWRPWRWRWRWLLPSTVDPSGGQPGGRLHLHVRRQ